MHEMLVSIEQGKKNAALAAFNLKFWWSAELGGQPAPHVCILGGVMWT